MPGSLIRDWRFWCLAVSWLLAVYVLTGPKIRQEQPVFRLIAIADITRSMNATDYQIHGKALSRLDFVKHSLQALAKKLPCQSELGLGVFTERRSTLLFEPIEVCSGYNEISAALEKLDWRMAWAADSRIAGGLLSTLAMLPKSNAGLLFMTDGHEAPPPNPRYKPDFSGVRNKHKGMIVGVGGLARVAIPKFNAKGQLEGVYGLDDVPHRSTFGESDLNPEAIQGYNARNAPFGNETVSGEEHLTQLHETYLQQLSGEAGLGYHRLTDVDALMQSLNAAGLAVTVRAESDQRWQPALAALLLLALVYCPAWRLRRRFKIGN